MPTKTLNKRIILKAIFIIVLFALAGYFREYFFVQINNILYMKYYNTTSNLAVGAVMHVFERMSYSTLYYSKYPFTIIWTAAFFYLNYLCLLLLKNGGKENIRSLLFFYGIALTIAGITMAISFLLNGTWESDEYTLSRWLFGIAQSPIPALFLLVAASLKHSAGD